MSGFQVDHDALDTISKTLTDASESLDRVGKSVPGTPDAGMATPVITAVLAHMVDNASALVLGLAGAGDDVTESNQTYQEHDATAGDDLRKAIGEQ